MKIRLVLISLAVVLSLAINAHAIDRDAKMIDKIGVKLSSLDDGADSTSLGLWGETALATLHKDWALLVGISSGSLSPDGAGDIDLWGGELGIKYYLSKLTSVSLIGSFTQYDGINDPNERTGSLAVKHRLISAESAISPFMTGSVSLRSADRILTLSSSDTSGEIVVEIGAGCDLMLSDTMALVFEGSFFEAEELSDGWLGAFFIMCYWD